MEKMEKGKVTASGNAPRIDAISIKWEADNFSEWLREDVEIVGCVAKAEISYAIGNNGTRRIDWLTSAGLWGIESDSGKDYLKQVEKEQLADLREHLQHFGIKWDESKITRGGQA
jgi:hypothetical protein